MAHYQVMLRARCVAVVEAQSEEEAMNIAISSASSGDYEFVDGELEEEVGNSYLEAAKRHADLVA